MIELFEPLTILEEILVKYCDECINNILNG